MRHIVIHNHLVKDASWQVRIKHRDDGSEQNITVQAGSEQTARKQVYKTYPTGIDIVPVTKDAGFLGGQPGFSFGTTSTKGKFKKGQIVGIKNGVEMDAKILEVLPTRILEAPKYKVKTAQGYDDNGPGETVTAYESDLW